MLLVYYFLLGNKLSDNDNQVITAPLSLLADDFSPYAPGTHLSCSVSYTLLFSSLLSCQEALVQFWMLNMLCAGSWGKLWQDCVCPYILPISTSRPQSCALKFQNRHFLKIHFLPFFLQGCGRIFIIVIADHVNVQLSGICFCFLLLCSAGTCLELPFMGHLELQTVVSFCYVIKLSKLEARFKARNEAGWLGKHVKERKPENLRYWTSEVATSTRAHSVMHRAGEERGRSKSGCAVNIEIANGQRVGGSREKGLRKKRVNQELEIIPGWVYVVWYLIYEHCMCASGSVWKECQWNDIQWRWSNVATEFLNDYKKPDSPWATEMKIRSETRIQISWSWVLFSV